MKILTHPLHTGYDYELAKSGHEFSSVNARWDYGQRPKPKNWREIGEPTGTYDLAICGGLEFFKKIEGLELPIIWIVHADMTNGRFPEEIERRVSAVVFSSTDVADRNGFTDSTKKRIIEHSIDLNTYKGYSGTIGKAVCVSNCIKQRPEKRLDRMLEIGGSVPVALLGAGNEGVPYSVGNAGNYDELLDLYKKYSVFLNPSDIVSTSLLEAMGTGIPVVSFRPINFRDLIQDEINGFLVDDVPNAINRIKKLLSDPSLRFRIGTLGRSTISKRFSPGLFQARWNRLFEDVSRIYRRK